MSFNTSDGTFDPGMYGSIMQGLQLLNTLGKSASLVTTLQGGDNPILNGMSSSGVAAATHRHATKPKGTNSIPLASLTASGCDIWGCFVTQRNFTNYRELIHIAVFTETIV